MSSDSLPRTIPVKRRNGKLQSCEPCRKRKLSCDHRLPACGRCVRRGTTTACYYHPAPLTSAAPSSLTTPSRSAASSPSITPWQQTAAKPNHVPQVGPTATPQSTADQSFEQRLYGILSVPSAGILMESLPSKVGFLGMSSSSAVVAELNSSLGIEPVEEHASPRQARISDFNAKNGAQVLGFFQDIQKIQEFFDRRFSVGGTHVCRTIYRPIYVLWFQGIAKFMKKVMLSKYPDRLERHSLMVWRNTQKHFHCHGTMTAQDWASQATGENLRWEALGLILATLGIICAQLPSWDPIFKSSTGSWQKTELMRRSMELSKICVDMSKKCGSRNDAFACLHYEYLCLVTTVLGDTAIEVWTCLSDVCDTMTLMGLHLEQRVDRQTPFWMCELRLRLFNYAFSMDKFCATYLGRPPHLSYRYSVIQDIHDLTDDEICGESDEVDAAIARLDHGWTTGGPPHIATWRKAWVKRHVIREDILEIVIGPHPKDMDLQISQIRVREQAILDEMPQFVRISPEELLTNIKRDPSFLIPGRGSNWRPHDVECFLAIHAAIRHSDFLMERARVNKQKADPTQLIASARSLLSLVLKVQGLKDFLRDYQNDFTDMLAFYGVPPAGVLAMEMLKRDQINNPYDDFPRSEALQQLSVFVTALEDVGPEEGNYAICSMGLNAIRKVLDRLLSRPRYPAGLDGPANMLDDQHFGANIGNDADFLQWLSSVDFDAATWLDSTPHEFSANSDFSLQAASV